MSIKRKIELLLQEIRQATHYSKQNHVDKAWTLIGQLQEPFTLNPMSEPEAFDYNDPPEDGLYWIEFTDQLYDVDIDDAGQPIGVPTGETRRFVSLVEIYVTRTEDDVEIEFYSADGWQGDCPSDDSIAIRYAEVTPPQFPKDRS